MVVGGVGRGLPVALAWLMATDACWHSACVRSKAATTASSLLASSSEAL